MYNTIWYDLQGIGDFTWRVSDCEELVGVTHRILSLTHQPTPYRPLSETKAGFVLSYIHLP